MTPAATLQAASTPEEMYNEHKGRHKDPCKVAAGKLGTAVKNKKQTKL